MKNLRCTFFALTLIALQFGCASNQVVSSNPITPGTSIKNSKIYIYSLLDLRVAEFGTTMLTEFDKQLAMEFAKSNATSKVLRFRESDTGKYFTTTNSGMMIPIRQMLVSNMLDEKQFGADYRLIIFPSTMTLAGAWKYYDIRWEILDAKTNQRVWESTTKGKHLTLWKTDEDPQERARTLLEPVFQEMRKSGVL